jgi:hypothetical protein
MRHRRGIAAIPAVAAVCLLVAGVGGYGADSVLDEDEFADRAVATLRSDEVREEVGARIGSRLASARPELSPGEQLIQDAVAETVTSDPAFQQAFREGGARLHRALFADADTDASMTVEGAGAMLTAELRRRVPKQRSVVPRMEDVPLFTLGNDGRERTLRRMAPVAGDIAVPLSLLLAIAGFALLAIAVVREPDHRRAVWGAGLAVAAAGGLTAAGVTAAQDFVLGHFDTSFGDAVVTSVWDAYLSDLRLWALAVCAAGLVVAAAAGGPRPSPATMVAAPASRRGRALRAAALLAVAGLAVQFPELVLHTGLVALAAGLFYVAAGDLLRVLAPPRSYRRRARLAAGAAAMLAVIAVAAVPI